MPAPDPAQQQAARACAELLAQGRYAAAIAPAEALTRDLPEVPMLWHMLGAARLGAGDARAACTALEQAVALDARDAALWDRLGVARRACGEHAAAADAFARSLQLRPEAPAVLSNAAANACEMRRFDEALALADRALARAAGLGPALLARGNALTGLDRFGEAADALRRAVVAMPQSVAALTSYGGALIRMPGGGSEALGVLGRAVALQPRAAAARASFGNALYTAGRIDEACVQFRAALELEPDDPDCWSGYLFALSHAEGASPDEVFAAHRAFGERFESPAVPRDWSNDRSPERRLRLGFVSADLRDHAVAFFVEPLLKLIDRSAFELVVYYNYPVEDAVSARLRTLVDEWTPVSRLDDDALEARIRADRIDLLCDLSGHTAGNRLPVFARKPAPVQFTWIGYPGTTGLSAIDYRLVNGIAVPPGSLDRYFTEKLVRLRLGSRFLVDDQLPEVGPLPALRQGVFTFASFNRASKLGAGTVGLWSEVLRAVPDARMLVGDVSDGGVRARLEALFAAEGIAAHRVDYRPRLPMQDYLALHHEADLMLDSVPYSAGTTARHALAMGVPTLTLVPPGAGLAQRQAAGIMLRVGMPEWVADSREAFVRKAQAAAADPQALGKLRSDMRQRLRSACAEDDRDSELSDVMRRFWRGWCADRPTEAIDLVWGEVAE